jgi:serpin B
LLQDELGVVDFQNIEKTTKEINEWVKEKTRKKIIDLLSPNSLEASTKMTLVNAAYFKGDWASKFDVEDTKRDNFYIRQDKISMTKFMKQKGKFNYYTSEELRAHVLQMPYQGEDVSMIIILPPFEDDALYNTIQRMTPDSIQGVMAEVRSGFYEVDDLTVEIPKFKIEQTLELSQTLQEMGLSFFRGENSDFSDFLEAKGAKSESISFEKALHKSFIEVNEEGSEAAAATALFGFRSARPLFHTHFIANHPFLFLIFDEKTEMIQFFGVYQDPKSAL